MSRSHVGKVKLDLVRLERRETRLFRKIDQVKREIVQNRNIIDMLKKALAEKEAKVTPLVEV